jgi:hypothetical protein
MKRIRIALASAAMVAGLAFAGAKPAAAQVAFSGSFPLPHGRISIGIGDPFFRVGSYVPYGYTVIEDPVYGYGFYYRSRWIPVRPYGSSWLVCDQLYFRDRGFARPYYGGGYGSYGYRRYDNRRYDYRRFDDRRFDNRRFDDHRFDRRRDGRSDRDHRGDRDRDHDGRRDGRDRRH